MSDTLYRFHRLVRSAREEEVPDVDVAEQVMLRIRRQKLRQLSLDRPLVIIAAGSLALAAGVTLFIVPLIQTITDPLGGVFQLSASLLR